MVAGRQGAISRLCGLNGYTGPQACRPLPPVILLTTGRPLSVNEPISETQAPSADRAADAAPPVFRFAAAAGTVPAPQQGRCRLPS